ncbi:hypothetical protein AAZX31_19G023100 [Glycine max]|uniref:uncharacterized protein LOC114399627 n=1 Tax=Glycine soja TaxID=3848 RepID=UPI0003DED167|nr:uncharacterized protein LOC114399627 [Glycine soja]|eukprot:XP_006603874.1 uncharacterized protein LOC102664739 [Glycine max]
MANPNHHLIFPSWLEENEFGILLLEKKENVHMCVSPLPCNFSDDLEFDKFIKQLEKEKEENQTPLVVPQVCTQQTTTETPSGRKTSRSKRGRCPQPAPEWLKTNWNVECKERKKNKRIDKIYSHKESGFWCRSLVGAERYEKCRNDTS